jgi:hypothetical protein
MEQQNSYNTDLPVVKEDEDKLQRFAFSKRIAETIINRHDKDCLVIGIYGSWGEGKTSVLNFIEGQIEDHPGILVLRFNPWRYHNEDALLKNFFVGIAKKVGFKADKPINLFANRLIKWGKLSKIVKFDLEKGASVSIDMSEIGTALSDPDIEKLKKRIEGKLIESSKKLVVFIDDIDRLDKEEVHSIFRLVKLTADFKNTTYILSFDDAVVAKAIGDKYGINSEGAGAIFLEKIIQVPLRLPLARPFALNELCYSLMQKTFVANDVEFDEEANKRYGYNFSTNILPRLKNPRLAIRYNNAISFAIPLLKGEANLVDLLLMEAIKIFYPPYYIFIRDNAEIFVQSYQLKDIYKGKDEQKTSKWKEAIQGIMPGLNDKEREAIHELLIDLFPVIKSVLKGGDNSLDELKFETRNKEKRINVPQYFDRYFSYAVYKGEISDIDFEGFIDSVNSLSSEDIGNKLIELIEKSNSSKLIYKLRLIEKYLPWEKGGKLIEVISDKTDIFSKEKKEGRLSINSPFEEVIIFVATLIKEQSENDDIFAFCEKLMMDSLEFTFAYQLYKWISNEEVLKIKLFDQTQNNELLKLLIGRAKSEAGSISIFEKFRDDRFYFSRDWKVYDESGLNEYVNSFLKGKEEIIHFLSLFVDDTYSRNYPGKVWSNMSTIGYEFLKSVTNIDELYKKVQLFYVGIDLIREPVYWAESNQEPRPLTEIDIARQFIYRYAHDKPK